ncbi:unnamed protein product [Rotaria sp. Silwood2]|nr:unnamed protein product [Rotaria sp. Silwood2]CAF3177310.1 unnamed protein product [Rotaria sp. Silwood2]CAF3381778.1 unnamed protein product [Rotaria sp. Silwood2]
MYEDRGYGRNWLSTENNARRLNPYSRVYSTLGCLVAIGFVLIVIIVLSLIPIYISLKHSNTTNNNIRTSKIFINDYTLQIQAPFDNFNPQTVLSQTNNRQRLQAALTSMIQQDSLLNGSVIEINTSSRKSNRQRRQTSDLLNITFDLNITSNKVCSSTSCLNDFQSHAINLLSNSNKTTSRVRYELLNSTQIYWLYYRLPQKIQSSKIFYLTTTTTKKNEVILF